MHSVASLAVACESASAIAVASAAVAIAVVDSTAITAIVDYVTANFAAALSFLETSFPHLFLRDYLLAWFTFYLEGFFGLLPLKVLYYLFVSSMRLSVGRKLYDSDY